MESCTQSSLPRRVRRRELKSIVPLADSIIYEVEQRGKSPRRFAVSPRCVFWDFAEVEAWLAHRRAKPLTNLPHPDVGLSKARPVRETGRERMQAGTAVGRSG